MSAHNDPLYGTRIHVPPYDNGRVSGHACSRKLRGVGWRLRTDLRCASDIRSHQPRILGNMLGEPTGSVNALAIKLNLMHVFDDTITNRARHIASSILCYWMIGSRHAARFHYDIEGADCQGATAHSDDSLCWHTHCGR